MIDTADLLWYALDPLLRPIAKTQTLRSWIPPLRAYLRHVPWKLGKRSLWFSVLEPYFVWKRREFVTKTIFGSLMSGNTQELLQQRVYYFGVWEPNLTSFISSRLQPGDTFVDVGANIGYFTLLGSKIVGDKGRVVAIEASPLTFKALEGNLGRNAAGNVRAVPMAVSEQRGTLTLYRGPESHIGLATALSSAAAERGCGIQDEVPTAPLGEILTEEERRNARLIKIDVEGMEGSVVASMRDLLRHSRQDLEVVTEVDPSCLAQQGRTPDEILATFAEFGFHPYELINDYTSERYLPPREYAPPRRLRTPVTSTLDIVFSRIDAEVL